MTTTEPSKRQLGLLPAAGDGAPAATQTLQGAPGHEAQFVDAVGIEISHVVLLQLAPQVLDRIQFGSVGVQPFLLDASLPGQVVLHKPAAVSRQAVPQQNQLPLQVPPQVGQELQHLRRLDRPFVQVKVKIDEGHAGNHRPGLPVEVVLQDGGLSPRGPKPFVRVEFGGVGRQTVNAQAISVALQRLARAARAMRVEAVPKQEEGTGDPA